MSAAFKITNARPHRQNSLIGKFDLKVGLAGGDFGNEFGATCRSLYDA